MSERAAERMSVLSQRNTFALLLALAMVAAPHVERLPWWVTLLAGLLMLWRLYLTQSRGQLPGKWLLLLVVTGTTVAVYLHYRTIFGRDAGVNLLIVMLALKLLETRTHRDGVLLILLGYFLVITNFLYSQTIPTAIYMLLCVWIITAIMVGLHYQQPPPGFRHPLRTSGLLLAQSVPLMLALFIFFPRVQGPLWGMPADAFTGVSGLSDTMSPGTMSNLILSDKVAFRVSFDGRQRPLPGQLYWRGPVMWDFDGRTWFSPRFVYGTTSYDKADGTISYEVTLEPHNKRWLFALDVPGRPPERTNMSADYQLLSDRPVSSRMRYRMTSHLDYVVGTQESRLALRRAQQLPAGFNPRTIEFAQALRRRVGSDRAVVDEALSLFSRQGFVYTLSPPLLGTHSVDEFLFQTRSGFCEHYASAFAVLMRAAGIPARIVTGYLGGETNPVGDYMIVRQADAHAWTEVWLENQGWVRIDPTASVSPARVEGGINAALPLGDSLLMRTDIKLLQQLRLTWDSLSNSWNQWVLGFSPERQRLLLLRAGFDDPNWRTLITLLVIATGLITLAYALHTVYRMRNTSNDPIQTAYLRFCAKLGARGLQRNPGEGPIDYANRLAQTRPDVASAAAAITRLYVELRYGRSPSPERIVLLRQQVREFSA